MSDHIAQLRNRLQTHNYSLTKPRLQVFSALVDEEALSMRELIELLPTIDRASVYRTVELFTKLGVIDRIHIGWKYKLELSDEFSHHHHHITCTRCHKTEVLREDNTLEQHLKNLAEQAHFHITTHQLEIHGLCQSCQSKPAQISKTP